MSGGCSGYLFQNRLQKSTIPTRKKHVVAQQKPNQAKMLLLWPLLAGIIVFGLMLEAAAWRGKHVKEAS